MKIPGIAGQVESIPGQIGSIAEPLKLVGSPSRWTSRKLLVAVVAIVLVAVNRKLGLDLAEADILALAGLAVAYVASQGYVDARQGAAILECGEMGNALVTGVAGTLVDGRQGCCGHGRNLSGAPWPDSRADQAAGSEEAFIKRQAGFVRLGMLAMLVILASWCVTGCTFLKALFYRGPLVMLLGVSLALSACSPHRIHPDRSDYTPEDPHLQAAKAQYGIAYLRSSLAATMAAAEKAKRDDPANAKYVDSQFAPVIEELSQAVDAYDRALANEREDRWAWARALVGTAAQTAIRVGVPLLIEQAAHR